MKKHKGASPAKLAMITSIVIFFTGLFAYQIEQYLQLTHDIKTEGQVVKMGLIVQSDGIMNQNRGDKYAYLHDKKGVLRPYKGFVEDDRIEAPKSLAALFADKKFEVTQANRGRCYLYMYVNDDMHIPLRKKELPAFLIAGWHVGKDKALLSGSEGLVDWGRKNLTKDDFYCLKDRLQPDQKALQKSGDILDLPGYDFLFEGNNYSSPF